MRKELGKISRFEIGIGGYDDAMFGLSVTLSLQGSAVSDFDGTWSREPDESCKWTKENQAMVWAKMIQRVMKLMQQAKVTNISHMVGVPVEVTLNGNRLESWRVLEEVL